MENFVSYLGRWPAALFDFATSKEQGKGTTGHKMPLSDWLMTLSVSVSRFVCNSESILHFEKWYFFLQPSLVLRFKFVLKRNVVPLSSEWQRREKNLLRSQEVDQVRPSYPFFSSFHGIFNHWEKSVFKSFILSSGLCGWKDYSQVVKQWTN